MTLPSELKTVGPAAFQGCNALHGCLTIGGKVTAIPEDSFVDTGFDSVRFLGTQNIADCHSIGGLKVDVVHVPIDYKDDSFCDLAVDKDDHPVTTPETTSDSESPSFHPDDGDDDDGKDKKKLSTIAIISIVTSVVVLVVGSIIIVVVVMIDKKRKKAIGDSSLNSRLYTDNQF